MEIKLGRKTARRAFGEFALIVAGVLGALAVDGWVESRREVTLERDYLQRLELELEVSASTFAQSEDLSRRVESHTDTALRLLRVGSTQHSSGAQLATLYNATRAANLRFPKATYEELVSTGALRLIRNPELRQQLVERHLENEWLLDRFSGFDDRGPYRDAIRSQIPSALQDAILEACPTSTSEPLSCEPDVSEEEAGETLHRLRSDRALLEHLTLWSAAQRNVVVHVAAGRQATEDLLQIVRQELAR